jgi:hypothetical protein
LTFTQFAALSGPAARDDGATLAADHWRPPAGTIGWGAPTCGVLSDVATLNTATAATTKHAVAYTMSSTARCSGKTCSVVALGAVAGVVSSVNVVHPYSL